ncbi:MAG: hypothetical protein IT232_03275 [Flavobacteriales bacterium]|nr:hypothetical protein [Flavobacteriales bacterium]
MLGEIEMITSGNSYIELDDDEIEQFYDERNKVWWDAVLNKGHYLKVQEDTSKKIGEPWKINPYRNSSVITCPLNDRNKNYFTHELLHAFISVNGFYSENRHEILRKKDEDFSKIFCLLESGLLNSFQHLRMYPMFKNARYDSQQFRTDNHTDYKVKEKLLLLKNKIPYNQFFSKYIELYTIVIDQTNESKKDSYQLVLDKLEKIDKTIFTPLKKTLDGWIQKEDPDYFFDDLYTSLIDELEIVFKNH